MTRLVWLFVFLWVTSFAGVVLADDHASQVNKALEKLRANFVDLPISDFAPAPIDGLYEFVSDGTMAYYSPEKNLLLVGEIFAPDGRSLSAERLTALQREKFKSLPLNLALKIGNGPKQIVEFTDPECPYCQAYHKYIKDKEAQVTRYIFFFPLRNLHPTAPAKAVHILCSADPQTAFAQVYERKIGLMGLIDCKAGRDRLAEDEAIGSGLGIRSTPTLLLGSGERVDGFNQKRVAEYLSKQ